MCIICIEYQKQLLTVAEARRNMGEMVISPKHKEELEALLEAEEQN